MRKAMKERATTRVGFMVDLVDVVLGDVGVN